MGIVLSDFMSLDGVVQAPGGPDEDPDAGNHGVWGGTSPKERRYMRKVVGAASLAGSSGCTP